MKQFEKVTQSVEALAEFLSTDHKGGNLGCCGCSAEEDCHGKETCRRMWLDFLSSEVEKPAPAKIKDTLEKQLELLAERSGQCEDREVSSLTFAMLDLCRMMNELS